MPAPRLLSNTEPAIATVLISSRIKYIHYPRKAWCEIVRGLLFNAALVNRCGTASGFFLPTP